MIKRTLLSIVATSSIFSNSFGFNVSGADVKLYNTKSDIVIDLNNKKELQRGIFPYINKFQKSIYKADKLAKEISEMLYGASFNGHIQSLDKNTLELILNLKKYPKEFFDDVNDNIVKAKLQSFLDKNKISIKALFKNNNLSFFKLQDFNEIIKDKKGDALQIKLLGTEYKVDDKGFVIFDNKETSMKFLTNTSMKLGLNNLHIKRKFQDYFSFYDDLVINKIYFGSKKENYVINKFIIKDKSVIDNNRIKANFDISIDKVDSTILSSKKLYIGFKYNLDQEALRKFVLVAKDKTKGKEFENALLSLVNKGLDFNLKIDFNKILFSGLMVNHIQGYANLHIKKNNLTKKDVDRKFVDVITLDSKIKVYKTDLQLLAIFDKNTFNSLNALAKPEGEYVVYKLDVKNGHIIVNGVKIK